MKTSCHPQNSSLNWLLHRWILRNILAIKKRTLTVHLLWISESPATHAVWSASSEVDRTNHWLLRCESDIQEIKNVLCNTTDPLKQCEGSLMLASNIGGIIYVCYIFRICSLNFYVIVTVAKNIVLHHYSRVVMMVQFKQDSTVCQCFSVTSIS